MNYLFLMGTPKRGSCEVGSVGCPDQQIPILVDWTKLGMIILLIILFIWWVYNWKRETFKEWWEDK